MKRIAAHAPTSTHAVVGLSVRSLFDAILAETGDAPVIMSAITISDMATLAAEHGRTIKTVDISMDKLTPTPDAIVRAAGDDRGIIVIAHLYGGRTAVGQIAASAPTSLIIEDCAQAFDGALDIAPGAAVALFSFGPIKSATALGGAIGLFRDPDLANRVLRRMDGWPALDESWFLRRIAKFAGLKLLNASWLYGLFFTCLLALHKDPEIVIGRMARSFAAGRPIAETVRRRPPLRLLRLLERRLGNWRAPPDVTGPMLEKLSRMFTVPGVAAKPKHWWLAPMLTDDPDTMIAALRCIGYDATRGATSMRVIGGDDAHETPQATRLINSVVYLPKPRNRKEAALLASAIEAATRNLKAPDSSGNDLPSP